MPSKTHKTAVAIVPPQEVWPAIQAIRRRFDKQFRRWMPHVNLLYPFVPREDFDAAAARLAEACAEVAPLELELARFERFVHRRGHATMWLAPEPGDRVVGLQEALWRAFPICDDVRLHNDGFTPHLSVAQAAARDQAKRRMQEWQDTWRPLRFTVSSIQLIWRDDPPRDKFRVDREIALGERAAMAAAGAGQAVAE